MTEKPISMDRTVEDRALVRAPFESAAVCVRGLVRGGGVTGLTCGQFSLLDLVLALLEKTGPADVRLSTWSTGIRDAETAGALLKDGRIKSLRMYTDRSFPSRQPKYAARVVQIFGPDAIKCTRIHAKIALIQAGGWRLVVRSSMNLNKNPRFEQFDVDDSPQMFEMIADWLDALDRETPGLVFTNAEVERAFKAALSSTLTDADAVGSMVDKPSDKKKKIPAWMR